MKELFGTKIGSGSYRDVYQHIHDDRIVIKVLREKRKNNCNEYEWKIWQFLMKTNHSKYFCPCLYISDDKKYLFMWRCEPLDIETNLDDLIKEVKKSGVSYDIVKHRNWGLLNGNPVLIDYGHHHNIFFEKK